MSHLLLLSSSQNDFLRHLLLDAMRHYSREIDADVTLYTSVDDDDDMKEVFTRMLNTDRSNLDTARCIYKKLQNLL